MWKIHEKVSMLNVSHVEVTFYVYKDSFTVSGLVTMICASGQPQPAEPHWCHSPRSLWRISTPVPGFSQCFCFLRFRTHCSFHIVLFGGEKSLLGQKLHQRHLAVLSSVFNSPSGSLSNYYLLKLFEMLKKDYLLKDSSVLSLIHGYRPVSNHADWRLLAPRPLASPLGLGCIP